MVTLGSVVLWRTFWRTLASTISCSHRRSWAHCYTLSMYKQLESMLSSKWYQPSSNIMGWLHCSLSFSLLRASILALKRTRSSVGHLPPILWLLSHRSILSSELQIFWFCVVVYSVPYSYIVVLPVYCIAYLSFCTCTYGYYGLLWCQEKWRYSLLWCMSMKRCMKSLPSRSEEEENGGVRIICACVKYLLICGNLDFHIYPPWKYAAWST